MKVGNLGQAPGAIIGITVAIVIRPVIEIMQEPPDPGEELEAYLPIALPIFLMSAVLFFYAMYRVYKGDPEPPPADPDWATASPAEED